MTELDEILNDINNVAQKLKDNKIGRIDHYVEFADGTFSKVTIRKVLKVVR